jgi:hypothetical protein
MLFKFAAKLCQFKQHPNTLIVVYFFLPTVSTSGQIDEEAIPRRAASYNDGDFALEFRRNYFSNIPDTLELRRNHFGNLPDALEFRRNYFGKLLSTLEFRRSYFGNL